MSNSNPSGEAGRTATPKVGDVVQNMRGAVGEVLDAFRSGGNDWLTVRWFDTRKTKGDCMAKSIIKIIPANERVTR